MADNTIAGFRLSAQQERTWSHQQEAAPFRTCCSVLLEGALDIPKLQSSLRELILRHEILRTVFHRQAGLKLPFQVIRDKAPLDWQTLDLPGVSESAQQKTLQSYFTSIAFNFEEGPILHALLASQSPDQHRLVLVVPALASDARSLQNLVVELGQAYAAAFEGRTLGDDVMQYADVVQWQTELLESDDTKAGRDFWRDYCRNLDLPALANTALPMQRKNDAAAFAPAIFACNLDTPLPRDREQTSNLLLACWTVLLCRLTGRSSVILGHAFDGRKYEELESAIGLFARHLPIQLELDASSTFNELLSRTAAATAEAYQWQESFDWSLVEGSNDSAGPMLPLLFEYTELPERQEHSGLALRVLEQYACWDRFKLKLSVVRAEVGLRLDFHYDSARFEQRAIEQLAGYFQNLLRAALEQPDTRVSRLPLLGEAERHQLLTEWNQTAADYPADLCLQQLFEAQAARTPDRPAIRFNDKQLSYRELNEAANQMAHHLRSLGVKPDSLAVLVLERSAEMMVALLAILKAGGAYIPLNPNNPKPRLAQQLAGAVALITEQKLLPQMPAFAGTTLVLDRDQPLWSNQPH